MGVLEPHNGMQLEDRLGELNTARSSSRLALISGVRSRGIRDHIALPQLVVCGDQSAGRRSILEGITGIPFPRQDGLCTRFATESIFEHAETAFTITASIIPASARDDSSKERLQFYVRLLETFSDLPQVIAEVGEHMGLSGSAAATFEKDVLWIKVSGNTRLHLTVVDLSGLISVPNEEQTDADVDTVHALVDSYAANPRTIILAGSQRRSSEVAPELAPEVLVGDRWRWRWGRSCELAQDLGVMS